MSTEGITPQMVEEARRWIKKSLEHPFNGDIFKELLNKEIQRMVLWRVNRRLGLRYPPDPDLARQLVYQQRACSIVRNNIFVADSPWEDHDDLDRNFHIDVRVFRVSGELFFVRGLPLVPIVRCDAPLQPSEFCTMVLKRGHVLLGPDFKVI